MQQRQAQCRCVVAQVHGWGICEQLGIEPRIRAPGGAWISELQIPQPGQIDPPAEDVDALGVGTEEPGCFQGPFCRVLMALEQKAADQRIRTRGCLAS